MRSLMTFALLFSTSISTSTSLSTPSVRRGELRKTYKACVPMDLGLVESYELHPATEHFEKDEFFQQFAHLHYRGGILRLQVLPTGIINDTKSDMTLRFISDHDLKDKKILFGIKLKETIFHYWVEKEKNCKLQVDFKYNDIEMVKGYRYAADDEE